MATETQTAQLVIPNIDFVGMARALIAEKLTEALIGAPDMINKIVVGALTEKVDRDGNVSRHSFDNKYTFIELTLHKLLRAAVRDVVVARIDAMRPQIEDIVAQQLEGSHTEIAKFLASSFRADLKGMSIAGVPINITFGKVKKGDDDA